MRRRLYLSYSELLIVSFRLGFCAKIDDHQPDPCCDGDLSALRLDLCFDILEASDFFGDLMGGYTCTAQFVRYRNALA
jgi:hypothetical protein